MSDLPRIFTGPAYAAYESRPNAEVRQGPIPEHVAIIGMVPHSLENRLGLTAEATAGLVAMVEMLVAELADLGIDLQARSEYRVGHWRKEAEREMKAECV